MLRDPLSLCSVSLENSGSGNGRDFWLLAIGLSSCILWVLVSACCMLGFGYVPLFMEAEMLTLLLAGGPTSTFAVLCDRAADMDLPEGLGPWPCSRHPPLPAPEYVPIVHQTALCSTGAGGFQGKGLREETRPRARRSLDAAASVSLSRCARAGMVMRGRDLCALFGLPKEKEMFLFIDTHTQVQLCVHEKFVLSQSCLTLRPRGL